MPVYTAPSARYVIVDRDGNRIGRAVFTLPGARAAIALEPDARVRGLRAVRY